MDFLIYHDVFPDTIPPLYHYTSPAGLLGILTGKCIWLSQLNYSNDLVEYSYAISVIQKVLEEYGLGQAVKLDVTAMPATYSFSLSQNGDILSQWRGYCPQGGYSVRFYQPQLDTMMKNNQLTVGKCIYDKDSQEQFVRECIIGYPTIEAYYNMVEIDSSSHRPGYYVVDIAARLYKYLPLIKHYKFAEEAEWRIFISYSYGSGSNLDIHGPFLNLGPLPTIAVMDNEEAVKKLEFRSGRGMIIPYLKIALASDNESVCAYDVIVGPTSDMSLSLISCQMLMKRYSGNEVHVSNIPYKY